MKSFKKGDKLVCVSKSSYWPLTKGKVYEASRDSQGAIFQPDTYTFVLGDFGDEVCCYSHRFEKVEEPFINEECLENNHGNT